LPSLYPLVSFLDKMSSLVRSKMIVLRKTKYSEADLIIQGLLESGNKISLIARGALRSKKRFGGGVLEPMHLIEVQYQEPRSEQNLGVLSEAQLLRDFCLIRQDYDRVETALQILEWVNRVGLESGEGLQDVYHLLGHALSALERAENLDLFRTHFLIRFLNQQGVLEGEPWMELFLKTPMAKSSDLFGQKIEKAHLNYLTEKLNLYAGSGKP